MPRLALPVAAVALVAVASPPALAADHTITASNFVFTDSTITIAPGDRVLFANDQGMHNFVFEDGAPAYPASPMDPGTAWTGLNRVFPTVGTYPYYCMAHGGVGGAGMSGTVTVSAIAPPPPPPPPPPPGGGPTPSPNPGPGGGGTTPAGGAPGLVRSLKPAAKSFCARRSAICRKPGVRLKIDLTAPAQVRGVLKRKAKRFGSVDFGTVSAGPRTLRFQKTASGKRLKPGRYTLAVTVDGAPAKTLRIRIRQPGSALP